MTLTKAEYCKLVRRPCRYCGARPLRSRPHGLDRWDNVLGYTPTNAVPCCAPCNLMKFTHTEAQFLVQVMAVVAQDLGRHHPGLASSAPADRCVASKTTLAPCKARESYS